jgi:thiol-disulfide isomerase/thioredoxin
MSSKRAKDKTRRESTQKKHGLSRAEKIAIPIIIIIAIWVAYSISQPAVPTKSQTTTTPGSSPTDFTLPIVGPNGLTGKSIGLSSLRGKVVLLEFMEPWCEHCQAMTPTLDKLNQQFSSQNVVIVSIAGPWQGPDGKITGADDVAGFIRNYGSSWTYAYDSSGSVLNAYGVNATPTFVIIGKNGSVGNKLGEGEQSYETLAGAITQALR